jgi:hypothetical protein
VTARNARLRVANVPLLSHAFRWIVLRGSIVHDVALTRRAADRRRSPTGTVRRA